MRFFHSLNVKHGKIPWIVAMGLVFISGLFVCTLLSLRFLNTVWGLAMLGVSLFLLCFSFLLLYELVILFFRPIQTLIQQSEETLKGERSNGISISGEDEVGRLANNFNQIILDARMKRLELESSNLELASHAAIIEKTYRELDKKVYDLFTLFNIGKELNSTLSVENILKIACFTSMGQLGVTAITMALFDERQGDFTATFSKGLRDVAGKQTRFTLSEAILGRIRTSETILYIDSLAGIPECQKDLEVLAVFKVVMIFPLVAKDQIIGLMLMGKRLSKEEVSQGEKDFISTLASLAALALRNAQHYEQAITDDMTQLYLKRYFQLRLEEEMKRASRYLGKLTVLMLDIDFFKRINDTYGHPKGDQVLTRVAKAIRENFRDVDVAARYGGEEFSVLMPEVGKDLAWIAAERLRKAVENLVFPVENGETKVTVSIGLAEFPTDGQNPLQLVEAADAALYRSKQNGRNQTTLA